MLSVTCKACGASFYVPQEQAGHEVKCGACGRTVLAPEIQVELEEPPVELTMPEGAWEYLVVADRGRMGRVDQEKLNALGAERWELVSVYREHPDSHTVFYFKRPHQGK